MACAPREERTSREGVAFAVTRRWLGEAEVEEGRRQRRSPRGPKQTRRHSERAAGLKWEWTWFSADRTAVYPYYHGRWKARRNCDQTKAIRPSARSQPASHSS